MTQLVGLLQLESLLALPHCRFRWWQPLDLPHPDRRMLVIDIIRDVHPFFARRSLPHESLSALSQATDYLSSINSYYLRRHYI